MLIMKLAIAYLFIVIMTTGLLSNPVFVFASDTCYVDKDTDDDGDGSDDEPYQNIEEALYKDCDKIIVEKGIYKDDITIGQDVEIDGVEVENVIIVGKVIMKDGSELKNITVSDSGIDVADGASVKIDNVKIKNASTGIETVGNGMLSVKNSVLYGNGKAMYLQKGKNVELTNNEVYDNDEEGIDIRANVSGIISKNSIYSNGENGIEVILGKSDLKIYDNKIKKNGASGIVAQYYISTSKLGGVKIKDNIITDNKDYGINCKAPSGGNPGVDYWTKSMEMLANKVYDNKDGDFSEACYFDTQKIDNAIKTKKQQEQKLVELQKEQEQKINAQQAEKLQEAQTQEEQRKKEAEQKISEQKLLRKKLQQERNLQSDVEVLGQEVDELYGVDNVSQKKIKNRPSIVMFFIGPDYKELRVMAERIGRYDTKIQEAQKLQEAITDEAIKKRVEESIANMVQEKNSVYNFIKQYNDEFSFFGWMFKKRV